MNPEPNPLESAVALLRADVHSFIPVSFSWRVKALEAEGERMRGRLDSLEGRLSALESPSRPRRPRRR